MNLRTIAALLSAASLVCVWSHSDGAIAQEWRPFDDRFPPWGAKPERRSPPPAPAPSPSEYSDPYYRRNTPSPEPRGAPRRSPQGEPYDRSVEVAPLTAPVERSELPPVMASDGSGLPLEVWGGLDAAKAAELMAGLELPPRSMALTTLWRRLVSAPASGQLEALRAEALYRSGLMQELGELFSRADQLASPMMKALAARYEIAVGQRDAGCSKVREAAAKKKELTKQLAGEMLVLAGYCASAGGDRSAASLAEELAREEGVKDRAMLELLRAVAAKRAPKLPQDARLTPTHFRLLELTGAVDPLLVAERGTAALLGALVLDPAVDNQVRVAAAEAAAREMIITPEALAEVYRAQTFQPDELANPLVPGADPLLRRAQLFVAAERERHPTRRAQILRALLDEARQAGFYVYVLSLAAPLAESIPKGGELGWFAETGIETALVSGNHADVRAWVAVAGGGRRGGRFDHWLALSDILDTAWRGPRGAYLPAVEMMAVQGQFSELLLHRLATVLDALDYQVPMELWRVASSTPQPNDGHLPETGVLTELQVASEQRESARTILLAMKALGPRGGEGAHIIALGDVIRALKRVGLEADARRIGFEALFGGWPRSAIH
jgi:hypothetical protein